jgi:hypothetical protein
VITFDLTVWRRAHNCRNPLTCNFNIDNDITHLHTDLHTRHTQTRTNTGHSSEREWLVTYGCFLLVKCQYMHWHTLLMNENTGRASIQPPMVLALGGSIWITCVCLTWIIWLSNKSLARMTTNWQPKKKRVYAAGLCAIRADHLFFSPNQSCTSESLSHTAILGIGARTHKSIDDSERVYSPFFLFLLLYDVNMMNLRDSESPWRRATTPLTLIHSHLKEMEIARP